MKTSGLRRLGLLVGLGLIAALAFSATASAHTTAPAKKVKIGYINLSDQLPFVVLVRKGIEKAAKAAGAQLVECDSNLDAQKAINCAAQLKSQGVQGILNFQLDTKAAPRVCAAGPKVPVIAIDIHQPPCEKVFYGANNIQAGKLDGAALGAYAKKTFNCKVDGVLSINSPTAGKVILDREKGELQGLNSVVPRPQGHEGHDERDDGRHDPAVHRHALAAAGRTQAARRRDQRRPGERRHQGGAVGRPARRHLHRRAGRRSRPRGRPCAARRRSSTGSTTPGTSRRTTARRSSRRSSR